MNSQRGNAHTSAPETKRGIRGFTLVELLVVIAIIGILAGIVVPNVSRYIEKSRVTRAVADIQGIETALTGMLSDTERSDFQNWFVDGTVLKDDGISVSTAELADLETQFEQMITDYDNNPLSSANRGALVPIVNELTNFYTNTMYQLMRQGKNAEIAKKLKPEIRQKLGNAYLSDLGLDPWGGQFKFWFGPMRGKPQMFRSYRLDDDPNIDLDDMPIDDAYKYTTDIRNKENAEVPGAPPADFEDTLNWAGNDKFYAFYGFPAPKDLPMYVYSHGKNNLVDANALLQPQIGSAGDYAFYGGGDDINNWDNESGWQSAPQ